MILSCEYSTCPFFYYFNILTEVLKIPEDTNVSKLLMSTTLLRIWGFMLENVITLLYLLNQNDFCQLTQCYFWPFCTCAKVQCNSLLLTQVLIQLHWWFEGIAEIVRKVMQMNDVNVCELFLFALQSLAAIPGWLPSRAETILLTTGYILIHNGP